MTTGSETYHPLQKMTSIFFVKICRIDWIIPSGKRNTSRRFLHLDIQIVSLRYLPARMEINCGCMLVKVSLYFSKNVYSIPFFSPNRKTLSITCLYCSVSSIICKSEIRGKICPPDPHHVSAILSVFFDILIF